MLVWWLSALQIMVLFTLTRFTLQLRQWHLVIIRVTEDPTTLIVVKDLWTLSLRCILFISHHDRPSTVKLENLLTLLASTPWL